MPCSTTPSSTLLANFMLAANQFAQLASEADTVDAFMHVRECLWALIETALDPAPYSQSWLLINLYAQADLLELHAGELAALDRLKEKVAQSVELLL